jgi:transcriptional repressor NrdR
MICPSCQGQSKVIASKENADGTAVIRRRECLSCGYRYITIERFEREVQRKEKQA